MNHIFRNLLVRYQNNLLEFYQLIEDKNIIDVKDTAKADQIKKFLENVPELETSFEIGYALLKKTGELTATWSVNITEEGFSVRSFSLDDYLEEVDEWYFHYHDSTQEYEGNLFTDGDWDLFLEEIAEVDDANGEAVSCKLEFRVGG